MNVVHAVSRSELAHVITIEPLSFYYASLAYISYRDSLLNFLALVRLRLKNQSFVLAPSSLPLRLHLFNLPNEITHEIYDYLFHSLIETEKLNVLDRIGLCPHRGACLSSTNSHRLTSLCPTLLSEETRRNSALTHQLLTWSHMVEMGGTEEETILNLLEVESCGCVDCARRRRERRDAAIEEGEFGGVCLVDFIPSSPIEGCCFEPKPHDWSGVKIESDGDPAPGACQKLQFHRGRVLGGIFDASESTMNSLVASLGLTLFSQPSLRLFGDDEAYEEEFHLLPAIVGIGSVSQQEQDKSDLASFNLVAETGSLSYASSTTNDWEDKVAASLFYVEELPKLTTKQLESFARFGKALRLPKEEAVGLTRFSKFERRYEAGRKREWKNGWEPSLAVVNKVCLEESEGAGFPWYNHFE